MAIDLRAILQAGANPQEFDLANIQAQMGAEEQAARLQQAIGQFGLETRQLPDINAEAAARGAFHSTGTTQARARAREDQLIQQSRAQFEANRRILDLITASGLIPFGRRLG